MSAPAGLFAVPPALQPVSVLVHEVMTTFLRRLGVFATLVGTFVALLTPGGRPGAAVPVDALALLDADAEGAPPRWPLVQPASDATAMAAVKVQQPVRLQVLSAMVRVMSFSSIVTAFAWWLIVRRAIGELFG